MGYPTSVFSPAARSNGQVIDASHINDLQTEVTAIENAVLGTITHSINISGASTLASLHVTGNSTVAGSLVVSGNTALAGGFNVAGVSTLASLHVTGNSTIAGSQVVLGNVSIIQSMSVGGPSTLATLQVNSNSTIGGSLSVIVNAAVSGSMNVAGGLLLSASVEPSSLATGDTNDWAIASTINYVRVKTAAAGSTLTGIASAGGDARVLVLTNVGPTGVLGLKNASGSVSTNQFSLASDTTVAVSRSVTFRYDPLTGTWWMIGNT